MKTIRILVVTALLVVSTAAMALTFDGNGKLTWRFVKTPYSTSHDSSGIPKVIDKKMTVPSDFLTRLAAALPEQRNILTTNPDLISGDFGANVHLKKDADVYVTFIHEAAGYKNSLAYFTFPDDNIPTTRNGISETVIFPNASYYNDGGSSAGMHSGDTQKIGHYTAGTNVGFAVIANGFDSTTGVTTNPTGGPPGGGAVYYTIMALNPEADPTLRAHTVLLNDTKSGFVVLGMEDMNRSPGTGCDHDFNDTIYSVTSIPADAIDVTTLAPVPEVKDADGDGVLDANDDYPNNPNLAFDIFTPSQLGFGTFVYEDSWPSHGDYDFNDVVLKYRFQRAENKAGQVWNLTATFQLAAWGSANRDGFAIQFPGIAPSVVQTAVLTTNGGTAVPVTAEAGQSKLVYKIFDDQGTFINQKRTCLYFNTEAGCYDGDGPTFELKITFKAAQDPNTLGAPPWDPFIYRTGERGHEIHLPDHAPTDLADSKLFGTGDDNSSKSAGRWYKSVCNLPFALDIPVAWAWPLEEVELSSAYPNFLTWVSSSGAQSTDWYKTGQVTANIWSH